MDGRQVGGSQQGGTAGSGGGGDPSTGGSSSGSSFPAPCNAAAAGPSTAAVAMQHHPLQSAPRGRCHNIHRRRTARRAAAFESRWAAAAANLKGNPSPDSKSRKAFESKESRESSGNKRCTCCSPRPWRFQLHFIMILILSRKFGDGCGGGSCGGDGGGGVIGVKHCQRQLRR